MAARLLFFAIFLCVYQGSSGLELGEVKKAAVKAMTEQMKSVEQAYYAEWAGFKEKHGVMETLERNRIEYAEFIFNATFHEIDHIVVSAVDRANLLSSTFQVRQCIDARGREAQDQVQNAHSFLFEPELKTTIEKGIYVYSQHLWKWLLDGEAASNRYDTLYNASTTAIQRATSEKQVADVLSEFGKYTEDMIRLIKSLLPAVTETQIQYERMADKVLGEWRKAAQLTVHKAILDTNACFTPHLPTTHPPS